MQSLTQCGKGKWWRNQPRWLERGTKQALVKRQLTMCELLKWSGYYSWGLRSIIPKPYRGRQCNASNILWLILEWLMNSSTQYHEWRENSKSLVQDGNAQEDMQCWNPKYKKVKVYMARLKHFKAQVVELRFTFNLECRNIVLSRGIQHWLIDNTQSAHRSPSDKT